MSVDSIASLVDEYDKREPYSPGDATKIGIFWRSRTIGADTSTAWEETLGETVSYRLRDVSGLVYTFVIQLTDRTLTNFMWKLQQILTDETYSREVAKISLLWKKV